MLKYGLIFFICLFSLKGLAYTGASKDASFALSNAQAAFELAQHYLEGTVAVEKDVTKAIPLLEQAASQGIPQAQSALGGLYYTGEGVMQDFKKAAELYHQAADNHNGVAQFNLGIMYRNGDGVPKDPVAAYYYLCLAAINEKELEEMAQDAAAYRDQVAQQLTPQQRCDALTRMGRTETPGYRLANLPLSPR